MKMTRASEVFEQWRDGVDLEPRTVTLTLGAFSLSIRSNSGELLENLDAYFAPFQADAAEVRTEEKVRVFLIEESGAVPGAREEQFVDWKREPGKVGRKDAVYELSDGRVVRKVRTGMQFLQWEGDRAAIGPCRDHESQVINFLQSQYMNWLQQQGSLICHASGLVVDDHAIAIAGLSGGGKSTLMLRLLDRLGERATFLTNDRLFLAPASEGSSPIARGIAKMPRINPGTILSIPSLHPLLDDRRRKELAAWPPAELWELEEKHDVPVDQIFGPDRIRLEAPLSDFVVLNWNRDASEPCRLVPVNLRERCDLLPALMKSPGPFYQDAEGRFLAAQAELEEAPYLDALEGVTIWEVIGRMDFTSLQEQLERRWKS